MSNDDAGQRATQQRYRKKPVVIEAAQYRGNNSEEVIQALGMQIGKDVFFTQTGGMILKTLESNEFVVSVDDYVIKGVKGEFYACKPDIFAATYDRADAQEPRRWHVKAADGDSLIDYWRRQPRHSNEYAAVEIIDQLEAELLALRSETASRDAIIEECAKIAEYWADSLNSDVSATAIRIYEKIRALKRAPVTETVPAKINRDWREAVKEMRETSFFHDGLAADLHEANVKDKPAAYVRGYIEALRELEIRLETPDV